MEALVPAEAHGPWRSVPPKLDFQDQGGLGGTHQRTHKRDSRSPAPPATPQGDQAPLEQCAYARLLIGWLTFEGPLPTSEKTPRQRRRAKDKLKQQRRQLEGKE